MAEAESAVSKEQWSRVSENLKTFKSFLVTHQIVVEEKNVKLSNYFI